MRFMKIALVVTLFAFIGAPSWSVFQRESGNTVALAEAPSVPLAGFALLEPAEISLGLEPSADDDYSLESRAAMIAHHLASGLWVVGRNYKRTPQDVLAQDIARFPTFGWQDDFEYEVDWQRQRVTVRAPGVPPRTAVYTGDQGSTILPRGVEDVYFTPTTVPRELPDADGEPWPMGDANATEPVPEGVNVDGIDDALKWALEQTEHNTRAVVVVYDGKIVGERYAPGWTKDTPQISWSQGKSITAALVGVLVQQGHFGINDFAPVKEWQGEDDPRRQIRIRDLLRMSSGLDFTNLGLSGPQSFIHENEHMRIYFDALNVFEHAVHQPAEFPPNTKWRYRNSDPLTLGRIVRETVESEGGDYLTFPQRALFDRIGARNFVLETDAWGNFILTGYDYGAARDWARFGLLHLWDGVWHGERILPEGWVEFVSTPAPADTSLGYGGLFWLNRGSRLDRVPKDAFWSAGFMGQITMIIPSRDVVVVRLGPSPAVFMSYLNELIGRVLEAISQS
ncbi:beta-lactamase family protein [bacterium]|nr:beta-lactamase family protein [bacterium]